LGDTARVKKLIKELHEEKMNTNVPVE